MVRIVLDAGHGPGIGSNRGGVLFNEGDQNYKFSLALKRELLKYENVEVLLTRNSINDYPEPEERRIMYKNVDLFLSLHTNAASADVRGAEIFVLNKNVKYDLASSLVEITSKVLGNRNRGVKFDSYIVLSNNTARIAYLIEHCFHTNYEDSKIYLDKQEELAQAQARVIAGYYNLRLKTTNASTNNQKPATAKNTSSSNALWRVVVGSFSNYENATKAKEEAKKKGYDAFLVPIGEEIEKNTFKTQADKEKLAKKIALGTDGWAGVYGEDRKAKVRALGFDSEEIQQLVNKLI